MSDIRLADLTGRARIRHAALALFAAEGYAHTSLRSIARKAQVSLALIAHHFGSKHQLRDAVDKWVLTIFEKAAAEAALGEGDVSDEAACRAFAAGIGDIMAKHPEVRGYLRRMTVVDAAPNGIALIGSLLMLLRGLMKRSRPPRSEHDTGEQSLQFLLLALGPALLEPMLQRWMPDLFAETARRPIRALDGPAPEPARVAPSAPSAIARRAPLAAYG
jgi:TetR/AcrR family transcriptional regulator, regulator of cefoperazone and chloramphenicol sensitivity